MYLVRSLAKWYSSQLVQIKWQDVLSEPFGVHHGVYQGSILLPCLFNNMVCLKIYVNQDMGQEWRSIFGLLS